MKVTLLGTGLPRPSLNRKGPSYLVEVGEDKIVFDCGPGSVYRLIEAGIDPKDVKYLFFTHHHFDHNADYAQLALVGWGLGRKFPLEVFGPEGTKDVTKIIFEQLYKSDVEYRVDCRRLPREAGIPNSHDISEGFVLEGLDWKVTGFEIDHGPTKKTFGYRIENSQRSVVISTDTYPCSQVVENAKNADILIHDCFVGTAGPEYSRDEWAGILGHTPPPEVGKIAKKAGVKTLVLTHMYEVKNRIDLLKEVSEHFDGTIIIGEDLMVL